ncbi:hypothetical protein DB30_07653 [Enhygromyxa salina]|uniref:Uncharacterized protein n=1 Tax=Enhygromyxa salina TaxID=215803 RepID=A0A0C2A5C2_9BACT|nr:hypothetical protein DB30_07653 [Enhygromyxa salina]
MQLWFIASSSRLAAQHNPPRAAAISRVARLAVASTAPSPPRRTAQNPLGPAAALTLVSYATRCGSSAHRCWPSYSRRSRWAAPRTRTSRPRKIQASR